MRAYDYPCVSLATARYLGELLFHIWNKLGILVHAKDENLGSIIEYYAVERAECSGHRRSPTV
jgi:hypothetical protein